MTAETQLQHSREVQNGTALAPRGPAAPLIITEEHRNILRQMVDRNATPAMVEMLIVVGNRYDLDPLMGHVVLINGKCFVTHKGLMHKAHASGQFDGIETEYGVDELGEWCECRVWRRDMQRPFKGRIYIGEYRGAGPVWKQYPRAMAAKTAESFVQRRAFDVSLTSQEEMGVSEEAPRPQAEQAHRTAPANPYPPQRQATPPQAGARVPQGQDAHPACASCSKAMTAGQATLSQRNYGETLCPTCQRNQQKPTAAPAPANGPAEDDDFEDILGPAAGANEDPFADPAPLIDVPGGGGAPGHGD